MSAAEITRIVIATHNQKKAEEMVAIFRSFFLNLVVKTLMDYPGAPEPEETGSSYAENALIKARSACQYTNELCLADDAGLEIDAFKGAPGVYSKRFGGEDKPFTQKMQMILEQLADVPEQDRKARFYCAVALVAPQHWGQKEQLFDATCEGRIAPRPSGNAGFGYDPIFWLPELGCTMADLTPAQKNAISHRGKVLAKVKDYLQRHFIIPSNGLAGFAL